MAVDSTQTNTQQSAVNEDIDPKILEILGLKDVFDFDPDEYILLLKEKMVEGRMSNSSMSTEDVEIITNEFKRVKGLKGSNKKLKVKKQTIKTDKFLGKKSLEGKIDNISTQKLLPPSSVESKKINTKSLDIDKLNKVDEESNVDKLLPVVVEIKKIAESILTSLQNQLDFKKKLASLSSKEGEKSSRAGKEAQLESKSGKIGSGLVETITKPFSSLFDRIQNFLLMTLLGSVANWIFGILQNPKKLLQPIQDLMDGIFGFFNNILQWIDNNLINPIRGFVDLIESGLNAFIGLVNQVLKFIPGSPQLSSVDVPNIPDIPDLKAPDIVGKDEGNSEPKKQSQTTPVQTKNKGGLIVSPTISPNFSNNFSVDPNISIKKGGGSSRPTSPTTFLDKKIEDASGSITSDTGIPISGLGQDTQLTALRPGEFVLVPGAAKALGIPFLEEMNKKHGGDNKERYANVSNIKIKKFQGGGYSGGQRGSGAKPSTSSTGEGRTGTPPTKPNQQQSLHPYLDKLSDGKIKKASAPPGYCVTGSLDTMQKSGVPNPAATGADEGNNPRGAAVQLIKKYGWKSIGGSNVTLKSPYGTVSTGIFSKSGYDKAVNEGKVPSGALIFQTRHSSWNGTSYNSRGYDMAIAQNKGRALWNGQPLGQWVYGNTQHVIALTPGGKAADGKAPPPGQDSASSSSSSSSSSPDSSGQTQQEAVTDAQWEGMKKWMIKSDTLQETPTSTPSSTTSSPSPSSSTQSTPLSSSISTPSSLQSPTLKPSSITPKTQPSVPGPPVKQSSPTILPLLGISGKQNSSGAMSGSVGTPPVDFSSENLAETTHRTAVKSLLNILE
jgi:hypothetical protein